MANAKNIEPYKFKKGDTTGKREAGLKGTRVQRERKTMAALARMIAAAPAPESTKKALEKLGIDAEDATNNATVTAAIYKAAIKGSVQAIDKWQQLTEDAKAESTEYLLPAREIGKAFCDINREIVPNKEYVFAGGRGSLKSTFLAFKIVELIKNNPKINACVVRKVSNTLKDSVFAQIKWCICKLDLEDEFKFTVSPAQIVYKKTGQTIYFRGADDPAKIKSIKPEMGYIGILWFEEADQFSGDAEMRNIRQSALRGGDESYLFKSFNPPKSKLNFMNQYIREYNPLMVVHESNYLETPKEWLGTDFLNTAEHLQETNPTAYENEYMGIANGAGGIVFEDVEARRLNDQEIATFDRIYQGVDWGWYPDQYAFIRLYYDATRETIYIFEEYYENKKSNEETGRWIIDHGYDDYMIICDSAEPKSVNDYIGLGLPARGAVKGPGSVEYGFKWLQRRKIIIDPVRCPNAYREFSTYEYEKDKDGNDISGYPDGNDHAISAVRYALERCMGRRENKA